LSQEAAPPVLAAGVPSVPQSPQATESPIIDLKDPALAGLLAWLVPGLGHAYQGRYGKAAVFGVAILGIFVWGLCLGSSRQVGPARVVYLSFRQNDMHWAFLCQAGVGLPIMPALLQAVYTTGDKPPLFGGLMAPPSDAPGNVNLQQLHRGLEHYFELGTVYTMIAGLLNVLAVYDACCGPIVIVPSRKEDDEPAAET
jgi:hypothetical protein